MRRTLSLAAFVGLGEMESLGRGDPVGGVGGPSSLSAGAGAFLLGAGALAGGVGAGACTGGVPASGAGTGGE